ILRLHTSCATSSLAGMAVFLVDRLEASARSDIGQEVHDFSLRQRVDQSLWHHRALRLPATFDLLLYHFLCFPSNQRIRGESHDMIIFILYDAAEQLAVGSSDHLTPVLGSDGMRRIDHLPQESSTVHLTVLQLSFHVREI